MTTARAILPLLESGESLSQLFGEHHRRVLNAAYRITGSVADAEDVTQAVFLRLMSSNNSSLSNPGSYLHRAAVNGALDLLRHRRSAATEPLESAAELADAGPGSRPERAAASRQLGGLLRQAIGELSPRAAEIFTLRYVEGLENREIAALCNTSQAVVAVTLHGARAKLKKRLKEAGW